MSTNSAASVLEHYDDIIKGNIDDLYDEAFRVLMVLLGTKNLAARALVHAFDQDDFKSVTNELRFAASFGIILLGSSGAKVVPDEDIPSIFNIAISIYPEQMTGILKLSNFEACKASVPWYYNAICTGLEAVYGMDSTEIRRTPSKIIEFAEREGIVDDDTFRKISRFASKIFEESAVSFGFDQRKGGGDDDRDSGKNG